MALDVRTAPAPVPEAPASRRSGVPLVLAALAGCWVVPLLAHALGMDWLVPPLILLGVASLLRAGVTLLDRLILALMILLGTTCAAGIVLSVWPWHLQPAAVGVAALSGLWVLGAVLRRRPSLPLRLPWADVVVLTFTGLAAGFVLWPFQRLSPPRRLGMEATGADIANHFAIIDAIRGAGGYPLLHGGSPAITSLDEGLRTYPQGAHIVGALLLNSLQSTASPGAALPALDTFLWFEPAAYLLLVLCALWALRRLAGPGAGALAVLPAAALATGYLVGGDLIMIMWMGALAEMLGLAQLVVLIAICGRPLPRSREQVIVVAALLVAISATYFLLLPIAATVALIWCLRYRRRLLPIRGQIAVVCLIGGPVAAMMPWISVHSTPVGKRLLEGGGIIVPNGQLVLTFVVLAAAGFCWRASWRSSRWQAGPPALALAGALILAIAIYQRRSNTVHMYYYFKAEHVVSLVAIVSLGFVARILMRPVHGRHRAAEMIGAGLASLGLAATAVLVFLPLRPGGAVTGYTYAYVRGQLAQDWVGETVHRVVGAGPADPDAVTVVWADRGLPVQATQWVNVLLRNTARSESAHFWVWGEPTTGVPRADIERYAAQLAPSRLRIVTDNAALLAELHAIQADRPEFQIEADFVPLPR
jgi:hypothetical protein